eukprot:TRINITY_DN33726_c0_g1_i1.p1 TRINITY_DN33726_c0_g1~~TRINITY_DN33726_c0_g1_i1.p1  ORF type:complete len:858 (+),score=249.12 TRINITY_DN33726_c0_g1_i1:61-2634(+)
MAAIGTMALPASTAWALADETSSQLQRWLAQEFSDRDSARFALNRLRTTAEFYRQRLLALLVRPAGLGAGEQAAVISRARDLVREMEAEVSSSSDMASSPIGTAQAASPQSAPLKISNYEVLRQSLKETQRQCESLNQEMVQQSEDNEGLVETLGTVKDANKRLLEQIRTQTAEIAQLTQQRVSDEERQEQMVRRHDLDRDSMRQDAHHQAMLIRDAGSERHSQVYRKLRDKTRLFQSCGSEMLADVGRLKRDLEERRQEALEVIRDVEGQMASWEQEIVARMVQPLAVHRARKVSLQQSTGNLRSLLLAEREERHQDNLDWARKHGSLQTDKEDLQARIARECQQLSAQLQALEKRQLEERQAWAEEKFRLERVCSDQQQLLTARRAMLEQLQRDVVVAETAASSAASESKGLDQVTSELRRQARESDDALAAAVSSNEHLREQLEEQRIRFQEKNAGDLRECRAVQEHRALEEQKLEEAETSLIARQIEAMEAEAQSCDQELVTLESDLEAADQDVAALAEDVTLWRSTWDEVNSSREALEKDFNDSKRYFHGDMLTHQTMCDRMIANAGELEADMQELSGELLQKRRWMVSREAESATRHSAAEGSLRESQELLASCRDRLRDAMDQRAKVNSEAEAGRVKAIDVLSLLEKNLESQVQALYGDRGRFEALLESERRAHEQAKEDCQRERELVSSAVRHVRDENRQRLEGAERERMKIEEARRAELSQGNEYIAQQQRHAEDLERDVGRVRALMLESESNLSFIRQECLQEEREAARLQRELEEELHELESHLERARREEASLVKQTEVQRFRSDQERRDLRRGLGDQALDRALSTGNLGPSPRQRVATEPVTFR